MKFTVAVLATIAVMLSAAPVMASVADSTGSNSGYEAQHRHHHHHHRRHHMTDHHMMEDGGSDVGSDSAV